MTIDDAPFIYGRVSPLVGEPFDNRSLVFAIQDPSAVRALAANFFRGEAIAEPAGLESVLDYLRAHSDASLWPLFPERGHEVFRDANWQLAVPDLQSRSQMLSRVHFLRLADSADTERLEDSLRRDPRVAYVHRPAIQYPLIAETSAAPRDSLPKQWGLERCRFQQVWDELEAGADPGPIGVIDDGRVPSHPELLGRIEKYTSTVIGGPSPMLHASQVAAVIGAQRGNRDPEGMAGCCAAKLHIHNIWSRDQYDSAAYYGALKAVAKDQLRVVNMSFTSFHHDQTANDLIDDAAASGVIFVAAMGDFAEANSPAAHPAVHPAVIGVGASNQADGRLATSSLGSHLLISAPGQAIRTVDDRDGFNYRTGTSFAAAMVSAAVWLALHKRPDAGFMEMSELLTRGVDTDSASNPELGSGRLDMVALANAL
jgi:hypothetical protein